MKITSYNHHLRLLVSPASLFLNNQRLTPGSLGAFVLIQSIQAPPERRFASLRYRRVEVLQCM
jgi:hypothetical protein